MRLSYAGRRARLLTGAATGLAMLAFAGSVSAQEEPVAETEELVVTGIRASIQNSIAAKRNETSIVEVVSAEDIGKLPDQSIAESLARLPGLATQRLDGRAQVISVRGLAPDFTTSLLNGREQVSAGDNRGVEFDQYPSELLGGVKVYKTPDAALIGQGLAGTVDLQTIRPLSFGRRAVALNARYEWNDLGALNSGTEDKGQRFSVSYIDQFLDGRLGIVLGYSNMSSPYQAERFNAWGYPTNGADRVIGGAKPYVQSSELKRDGYLATIEFRPDDKISSSIDVFYSEFDNTQILRGVELPLAWGGGSGAFGQNRPAPALSGTTTENGLITAGTWSNVKGVVRNDGNQRTAELFSIGWNTEIEFGEVWTAELDVNHSRVDRTDVVLETYAGTGRDSLGALDTLQFATTPDGTTFRPTLNYADPNLIRLTSPQGWGGDNTPGGQDGFINNPNVTDELTALRAQVERRFEGPISRVEVGVNFSSRDKKLDLQRFYLGLKANAADPEHDVSVAIPTSALLAPTQLGYLGLGPMVSYDPFALVASGIYNLNPARDDNALAFGWQVSEEVVTTYVQADLDTELAGFPLTGNFGLQYVTTDQSSDGTVAGGNPATPTPRSAGDSYSDVLPSMNLSWALPNDYVVRLAAARQLARPRMDDLRASINIDYNESKANLPNPTVSNSPWGGSGGNPSLRPWKADAFDISVEKYFGRNAYVALAAYYKDLKTYIYTQQQIRDFTGVPVPGGPEPNIRQGLISVPANGEGGVLSGVEFAFSTPLDFIHPALEGFGVFFSASQTDSEIEYNGPGTGNTALPGLSEKVVNGTVYYERGGFQARLSSRYRSDFLGELSGVGTDRIQRRVAAETVVDGQIGYEFRDGPLEGLGVLLQVINLTDEPFKTLEDGDERRVIDYQRYGRSFLLGVNYKF